MHRSSVLIKKLSELSGRSGYLLGSAAALTVTTILLSGWRLGLFYPDPKAYALRIIPGPVGNSLSLPSGGGSGIFLGDGLVLTAAHVAGSPDRAQGISVVIAGRWLPAQFLKPGDFDTLDVSLLSVDRTALPETAKALPRLRFCSEEASVGEKVDVIEPMRVTHSVIVSPDMLPPGVSWQFSSLIRDVASTGNSGSGVFDHRSGCFLGVMSRKIERVIHGENGGSKTEEVAKYFVPATKIANFFGELLRSSP